MTDDAADSAEAPSPRSLLGGATLAMGLAYLASYILLDRVSYLHPFGNIGITAWNPQTGLSFALVLTAGRRFVLWLLAAPLCADLLLRKIPPSLTLEVTVALIIGSVYSLTTFSLTRSGHGADLLLRTRADLLKLTLTTALSVLLVAAVCVGLLVANGYLQASQSPRLVLRYWVGDFIGITIVAPFVLLLAAGRLRLPINRETAAAVVLLASALVLIFGPGELNRFQLFYLLFVPVIWMAVRFGIEGVSPFLLLTQLSLVLAIQISKQTAYNVTDFQTLMLVLALTGLTMGIIVSEARQRQRDLWLHREALGRATRAGGMGELAAAIAHEVNQPLTAIGNYVQVLRRALDHNPPDTNLARDVAAKATQQVERAATVVRRLRDFIRAGRHEAEMVSLDELLGRTIAIYQPELDLHHIALVQDVPRDLPTVHADPLQVEQVVVNLLRNSIDALAEAGRSDGQISVEARLEPPEMVRVTVADNGPGFEPVILEREITPFTTTKAKGMGLGLSLSKSIIAAHGGALRIGGDRNGAVVSFTLPKSPSPGAAIPAGDRE